MHHKNVDFAGPGDNVGLDLGSESGASLQSVISSLDHDVTDTGHVHLVQSLNVQTDVVTRSGEVNILVVHLNGENLARARLGRGVSGQEVADFSGGHFALFDTASDDISDTLDLVHTGHGHAQSLLQRALGDLHHLFEAVGEGDDLNRLLL